MEREENEMEEEEKGNEMEKEENGKKRKISQMIKWKEERMEEEKKYQSKD